MSIAKFGVFTEEPVSFRPCAALDRADALLRWRDDYPMHDVPVRRGTDHYERRQCFVQGRLGHWTPNVGVWRTSRYTAADEIVSEDNDTQ